MTRQVKHIRASCKGRLFAAGSRVPVSATALSGRLVTDASGRITNMFAPKPKKTRTPKINGFSLRDFYDETDVPSSAPTKQSKAKEIFNFASANDFDQLVTILTLPGGPTEHQILRSKHRFFLFYKKEELIAVASYLHDNWTITSLIFKQGLNEINKRGCWKALEIQINRVLKEKRVGGKWYVQIFPSLVEKSGVGFITGSDYGWEGGVGSGDLETLKKVFNDKTPRAKPHEEIWREEEIV